MTSTRPFPADGARVDLQSEAPVGGRTRTRAQSTPRVAGDLKEEAQPWMARWSRASGEVLRRPGSGPRRGRATEGERARRGYREARGLTAELVQWSAMAGGPRRRRIERRPAVSVRVRVRSGGRGRERRRGRLGLGFQGAAGGGTCRPPGAAASILAGRRIERPGCCQAAAWSCGEEGVFAENPLG
jgi:hypothetical protein